MKTRNTWIGMGALAALVVGTPLIVRSIHARQEESEYREQLRLARAEGLPTTSAEFAATVRPALPAENAALLYRRLRKAGVDPSDTIRVDPDEADRNLRFHSNAGTLAEAKQLLASHSETLELVDRAVKLPRCWFERKWEGPATLFPEYAVVRQAAKLTALRGTVAACEGRAADAIADADRLFAMAGHLREEPTDLGALVAESIERIALQHVGEWSFIHRDEPAYALALDRLVRALPPPDLKREHRGDLYGVLSLIELCSTPKGRAELGLKEEDLPSGPEQIFTRLLSPSKSRIKIVQSFRRSWAALDQPSKERDPILEDARQELFQALVAFPTAARIYHALVADTDFTIGREEGWQARRQQYQALALALRSPSIPPSIDTKRWPSPFDGK
ncbi:MAG: hypothetical protein M9921_01615, partial [Fimbriimonadaceae bacterium]|nr:hypothetical protein [Fimbriimonadaceae bacterium]